MKSMTGYGKAICADGGKTLSVEIKSVNNRYLDINCKMPKILNVVEGTVRDILKKMIGRGSVDVFLNYSYNSEADKKISIDRPLVKSYLDSAQKLSYDFNVINDLGAYEIFRLPDVLKVEDADENPEVLCNMASKCVTEAVDALNIMREKEGATIFNDLILIIGNIESSVEKCRKRAPEVVNEYAAKIKSRVTEYLGEVEVDQSKLLNEVAFFADKADINEELSRLSSHISQFRSIVCSEGLLGRNLDFLSQEINREINTIGSKSNDTELTRLVVGMKNELEKIKEQIRNIE